MKTITINVFPYSELSDKSKQVVRERYRLSEYGSALGHAFDNVVKDFLTMLPPLGITGLKENEKPKVMFSCSYSRKDGAYFEGIWRARDAAHSLKAMKYWDSLDKELHRIAGELGQSALSEPNMQVTITHDRGRYSNSSCVDMKVSNYNEEGYNVRPADESVCIIRNALRDLMDWLYAKLLAEQEYQYPDKEIGEELNYCEDIYYTAEGKCVSIE